MKIRYDFITGEACEIEVPNEISEVIIAIETDAYKANRKETRRHSSIDYLFEQGFQIADDIDISNIAEQELLISKLYKALAELLPKQKQLVHKVFFEERSIISIAREEGVSEAAIRDRLKKIYSKLKKYL